MRTILFRGKSVKNGAWAFGYLFITAKGKHEILVPTKGSDFDRVEVDPKTVGQYTELTDMHGIRIFDGDIVKNYGGLIGVIGTGKYYDYEYECSLCGWYWRGKDGDGNELVLGFDDVWEGHEVAGSIYDKKEEM